MDGQYSTSILHVLECQYSKVSLKYCYEFLSILQFYADQQKLFVLLEKGDMN